MSEIILHTENTKFTKKFLVNILPDISNITPIHYKRYFLKIEKDFEDRIQQKGNIYEREQKVKNSNLSRTTKKQEITKETFYSLQKNASKFISRKSYKISNTPNITIK